MSDWSALDECERLPGCCSEEHHPQCPESVDTDDHAAPVIHWPPPDRP